MYHEIDTEYYYTANTDQFKEYFKVSNNYDLSIYIHKKSIQKWSFNEMCIYIYIYDFPSPVQAVYYWFPQGFFKQYIDISFCQGTGRQLPKMICNNKIKLKQKYPNVQSIILKRQNRENELLFFYIHWLKPCQLHRDISGRQLLL